MLQKTESPWQIAISDGAKHVGMASYGVAKTCVGKIYRHYLDFYFSDFLRQNKFIGSDESKIGVLGHLYLSSDPEYNLFSNPSLEAYLDNARDFINIFLRNQLAYRAPSEAFRYAKNYVGYASTTNSVGLHTMFGEALIKISNALGYVWGLSPIELGLYNQWLSSGGSDDKTIQSKCLGVLGHVKVARSSLYNLIDADERVVSTKKDYQDNPEDNSALMDYYYAVTNYIFTGVGTALSFILLHQVQTTANAYKKGAPMSVFENFAVVAINYNAAAIATGVANLGAEALELAANLALEYCYKKEEVKVELKAELKAEVREEVVKGRGSSLVNKKWEDDRCYFWSGKEAEREPEVIPRIDLTQLEFKIEQELRPPIFLIHNSPAHHNMEGEESTEAAVLPATIQIHISELLEEVRLVVVENIKAAVLTDFSDI